MSSLPHSTSLVSESVQAPLKITSSSIGKERKRVFLEAARLKETEFEPGTAIHVDYGVRKCVITSSLLGERIVAQRKGKPVIDIDNKQIRESFKGVDNIKITIFPDRVEVVPLEEELKQHGAHARAKAPRTAAELFVGGGTTSKAISDAGFEVKWAVELEDKYLENFEANHPEATSINMSIQDIDWHSLPAVDCLLAGIPCEAWTPAGKAKARDTGSQTCELHDTGYLGYYVLEAIRALRPGYAVIENVPGFASEKAPFPNIFKMVLSQMGYHVAQKVFYAHEYGGMTKRKRYCLVASAAEPYEFPEPTGPATATVESILEVPLASRRWLTAETNASIATFLRREAEHAKPGSTKNFGIGRVKPTDNITPTITKHYTKKQSTQPILCIEKEGVEQFSFFTKRELAALNSLPQDFVLPDAETTACEIIGQGTDYKSFLAIFDQIMKTAA